MDKSDVRLEAGDVLAAVFALLLLLGVRLALVIAHLEEVLEGDSTHRAVRIVIMSLLVGRILISTPRKLTNTSHSHQHCNLQLLHKFYGYCAPCQSVLT